MLCGIVDVTGVGIGVCCVVMSPRLVLKCAEGQIVLA